MLAVGVAALGTLALAPSAVAGQRTYEVTIEDVTSGQPLTPPVVATHRGKHAVFDVGRPASVGVREIAENGNSAPLLAFLDADPLNQFSGFAESSTGPLVPAGVGDPHRRGEPQGQASLVGVDADLHERRLHRSRRAEAAEQGRKDQDHEHGWL
jgi:hypothetical protein